MIFLNSLEVNKQKYPTGFLQSMYETQKYPIENKRNTKYIFVSILKITFCGRSMHSLLFA